MDNIFDNTVPIIGHSDRSGAPKVAMFFVSSALLSLTVVGLVAFFVYGLTEASCLAYDPLSCWKFVRLEMVTITLLVLTMSALTMAVSISAIRRLRRFIPQQDAINIMLLVILVEATALIVYILN